MLYFPRVSVYLLYEIYARIQQNPDTSFSRINRSGHRLQDVRQGGVGLRHTMTYLLSFGSF